MRITDEQLDLILTGLSKRGFSFPNRHDQNATDDAIDRVWEANRVALHYALEELESATGARLMVHSRM